MTSAFRVWKKDSMKALSPISRGRFMLWEGCKTRAEGVGREFDAAIGMEDQPGSRAPAQQGAIERGQRQGQVAPRRQAPTENAARIAIHDDGEVAPLAGALHVRHIAHPDLVGCRGVYVQHA